MEEYSTEIKWKFITSLCYVFQAKSTNLSNGLVQDEFEKTSVNMSTYLVAFIVANFTSITKNVSGTQVGLAEKYFSVSVQALQIFFSEAVLLLINALHVYTYKYLLLFVLGVSLLCTRENWAH